MTSLGLGGCLADDMGLGKTVTLIALHLHRQDPATAARPWWSARPRCSATGSARSAASPRPRRCAASTAPAAHLARRRDGRLRPDHLRDDAPRRRRLAGQPWGLVVADEAQHVKNPLRAHRPGAAHDPRRGAGSR